MRRRSLVLALACGLAMSAAAADPYGSPATLPPSVPAGFVVSPQALVPGPSSLAFSPDGARLYVADSTTGRVLAYEVVAGVVAAGPRILISGLRQPLGVVASADAVFVADSVQPDEVFGVVYRARLNPDGSAGPTETVIGGLPNGRHNTNGLAIADGMLWIANGNNTDSGWEGGPPESRPYSGSVLRVPLDGLDLTPSPSMVVATGFRNVFDLAFVPPGHPAHTGARTIAVATNGPDGLGGRPPGEDTLAIFGAPLPVEHFAFPWCLHDRARGGLAGFVQDPDEHPTPSADCTTLPPDAYEGLNPATTTVARPSALFGLHVSADGLAFNPGTSFPAEYEGDLFVAEWGSLFGVVPQGHKVVRARFAPDGSVAAVEDFLTGGLPLDVTFAPDGALWVADYAGAILRVAPPLP